MTELVPASRQDGVVILHRTVQSDLTGLPENRWHRLGTMTAIIAGAGVLAGDLPFGLPSLVGGALAFVPLAAFWWLLPWWWRRRLRALPPWNGGATLPSGVVRIAGRIEAEDQPFPAPGTGTPAVYLRMHLLPVTYKGTTLDEAREEIRGVRFRVVSDAGTSVPVNPSDVWLLDPDRTTRSLSETECEAEGVVAKPGKGRQFQQTVLQVGDQVELAGALTREVSVAGAAIPGRGVPMEVVVRPDPRQGVWIRRLGGT